MRRRDEVYYNPGILKVILLPVHVDTAEIEHSSYRSDAS